MNNTVFIVLIVALVLALVGGIIFTVALAAADWDFSNLDSAQYSTNNYSFDDSISSITICVLNADVNIVPSTDASTRVVCYEKEKQKHSVSVLDGDLKIDVLGNLKWYETLFLFSKPKIDIYLPTDNSCRMMIVTNTGDINVCEGFSFDIALISGDTSDISFSGSVESQLKIEVATGDVEVKDTAAADVQITVSTGDIDIENLSCNSFKTIGDTGDLEIDNLTVSGAVNIERSTGDVAVDTAAVGSLSVKTDTGDIILGDISCEDELGVVVSTGHTYINNSTAKSFISRGGTGDLNMSDFVVGGAMNIERSTGDVEFEKCDAGEVYITTDTGHVIGTFLSDKIIFATSSTGKIDVPKSTVGGKCEITTATGKIVINIAE